MFHERHTRTAQDQSLGTSVCSRKQSSHKTALHAAIRLRDLPQLPNITVSSGRCCGYTESPGGWLRLSGCSNPGHSSPTGQSSTSMFNPGQGYPAVSCPRPFLLSGVILSISCCFFDARVRGRRAFNYVAILEFMPLIAFSSEPQNDFWQGLWCFSPLQGKKNGLLTFYSRFRMVMMVV